MQPTLAITAPAPGMLFINGRFAGEADEERPLLAPVGAFGPVYLQYHPLAAGREALSRKLVMSGGVPMADPLPDDVFCIQWPGGITEVELSAPLVYPAHREALLLDGLSCSFTDSAEPVLEISSLRCTLPAGAGRPQRLPAEGCVMLTGDCGSGRYLLTLSPDLSRQTGFLRADRIELRPDGVLHAVLSRGDIAGHGTLERWRVGEDGLQLLSGEAVWIHGAPRRPSSPQETALAAVEAAFLGLYDEADGFLSAPLRERISMEQIIEGCDLCLPMKYGLPEGRSAVGLLLAETENFAVVRPLYYEAVRTADGWLLTELSAAPSSIV